MAERSELNDLTVLLRQNQLLHPDHCVSFSSLLVFLVEGCEKENAVSYGVRFGKDSVLEGPPRGLTETRPLNPKTLGL